MSILSLNDPNSSEGQPPSPADSEAEPPTHSYSSEFSSETFNDEMLQSKYSQTANPSSDISLKHHPRMYVYMIVILFMLMLTTCELKTGISFAVPDFEGPARVHEPWKWERVVHEFPNAAGSRLAFCMFFLIAFEFGYQMGRRDTNKSGGNP